ncbi:hypothetical protein SAMN05660662_0409 [Blastococcus aurantiacus]|uniref:DUF2029 domain-containing protein n=1 Tax=Blastococcus aurantiacus TaxID=1550231 RepID=A0A1G7RNJ1_9ACTN|nr:glycosyltransferase family 87 protein [Blastococcus aurantiacus]SDG12347.1 hypothetical protein SAMN05660662_0409 [Blastococcus aurantiacus]
MDTTVRRYALWSVPAVTLGLLSLVLELTGRWLVVGVRDLPTFLDLAQVTYNADCTDPSAGTVGAAVCDPAGRAYNYPPVWTEAFRLLGVGGADTLWFGSVLVLGGLVALSAFYGHFLGRPTPGRVAVVTALTASPPMFLMVARGNTDLFVLVALVTAALLISSGRAWWAVPFVAVSAGLKLFPSGAVLAFGRLRQFLVVTACSLVSLGLLALPYWKEIRAATPSVNVTTFGAGVLPAFGRMHDFGPIYNRDQVIGVLSFVVVFLVLLTVPVLRRAARAVADGLRPNEAATTAVLIGAGPALVTYLLTSSFDYRTFSLLFVSAGCLTVNAAGARFLVGSFLVAFWLSGRRTEIQFLGDALHAVAMPFLALILVALLVPRMPVVSRWALTRSLFPAGTDAVVEHDVGRDPSRIPLAAVR